MARTPYPVSGAIVDVDESTTITSGTITLINTTLNERVDGSIESDGSFSVDAANTTTAYSNGDKLQIVIYDADKVKSTEFRHTIDTSGEGYNKGTVYLHWTVPILGTSTLLAIVMANKNDSAEYTVDLYDRQNDHKLFTADIPANDTKAPPLGFKGIEFVGGVCVIRESDTANTVEVTMVVK